MKPYHNLKLISAYLFPSLGRRDRERGRGREGERERGREGERERGRERRRKRERDREISVHCNTYNVTDVSLSQPQSWR